VWAIIKVIFIYTSEDIADSIRGYFFDSHCMLVAKSSQRGDTLYLVAGVPVRCGNTVKTNTGRYGTFVTV